MHKRIDFTKPGGFPLTQDELAYLQAGYSEAIDAISGIAGSTTVPVRISGIAESAGVGGATNVSSGWFFYNGEIIKFAGATYSVAVGPGTSLFIVISDNGTPLTYNDGSTPTVIYLKTATLVLQATSTPTDANNVPYSQLISFGKAIGNSYRPSTWQSKVVSVDDITGNIYYKTDPISNQLQIRTDALLVASPDLFDASPSASKVLLCTLNDGWRPARTVYFPAFPTLNEVITDSVAGFHSSFKITIESDGKLYVTIPKIDSVVHPNFYFGFNATIPLD